MTIRLPNLQQLNINNVHIGRLLLTKETTPNLSKLSMSNFMDDADEDTSTKLDFIILCPELRDLEICYCDTFEYPEWVDKMLETATKL